MKKPETIKVNGVDLRKFIPFPQPVTDGTVRCIACGQIDEPEWHDDSRCGKLRNRVR